MKTCNKCGETKEFSEFHKDKSEKDGHHYTCAQCLKRRYKKLKESPLMQLQKAVKSSIRIENKILFKDEKRLCGRCKNIFLIADLQGKYCKKCNKEYKNQYFEENKEKKSEYVKQYREKNKEKIKEKQSQYFDEYYKKNKEKINERQRQYRLKLKEGI